MAKIYFKNEQGKRIAVEVSNEVAKNYREILQEEWRGNAYESYYTTSLERITVGDMEMYVPVNDKLGKFILLARRRVNFQKHIAKMRKVYRGRIESGLVIMDAEFIYVFEDVLEDKGYVDVIHSQIVKSSVEYGKILYDLFREDKSIRYLMSAHGYKQEQLQNVIRNFFEALKKIIF